MRISTTINGAPRTFECEPGTTLFEALRALGIKSVKQGCDNEGTCGACTILIDGKAVLSCITPAPRAQGRNVTTIEALGDVANPHPLQTAFVDAGAVQCGFCTPGMILAAKALLDEYPNPSREEIAEGLSGNLCRCTGYVKILDAVQSAAETMGRTRP